MFQVDFVSGGCSCLFHREDGGSAHIWFLTVDKYFLDKVQAKQGSKYDASNVNYICEWTQYRGADKSVARPGRKQATATKLMLLQATQKKSESCPSNQDFATAMTSASDEKWRPFNCFFSRVGLRTYQHPCISEV